MKCVTNCRVFLLACTALLLMLFNGCGRDGIKVYQVGTNDTLSQTLPPAQAQTAMPPAGMPMTMPAGLPAPDHSGLAPLRYILPTSWKEKELTQMRVASFAVGENGQHADVSVIPMEGMAGGDLANVNRWLGQIGQPSITENEVVKLAEKVNVGGQPADLYDLAGTAPSSSDAERILAVALHRDDMVWFFKMTGDATLVEAQKPAFVAFLKSVELGAVPSPAPIDVNLLPPSHLPIGGVSLLPPVGPVGDKPSWEVPAGWQEGPLTQFLVAKYIISGTDGAKAEVNVSPLNRERADLASNINRWRGQLGLAPAIDADLANLPTVDASGAKATIIELTGTDMRSNKPAALIGVVLPLGGQTWFYKLMGDPEIVAQQKEALIKFVQSAKYPDVH